MTAPSPTDERPYDLVKEIMFAVVVITALAVILAVLFGSPDERAKTIADWARADGIDFVSTALAELDGTSGTATYGPPYNSTPNAAQSLGPMAPAEWTGVGIPVDTATDFVLDPLSKLAVTDPALMDALTTYESAPADQQSVWTAAYGSSLPDAQISDSGTIEMPAGKYGPLPTIFTGLLRLARSGGLDPSLLGDNYFPLDSTKPLLFLSDGEWFASLGEGAGLGGDQWGIMNGVADWPGQTWLWLYTFWYQIPPWSTSPSGDLLVYLTMLPFVVLTAALPWIPGVRTLPTKLGLHRLIWKDHYAAQQRQQD
jgi:hypothetical protein